MPVQSLTRTCLSSTPVQDWDEDSPEPLHQSAGTARRGHQPRSYTESAPVAVHLHYSTHRATPLGQADAQEQRVETAESSLNSTTQHDKTPLVVDFPVNFLAVLSGICHWQVHREVVSNFSWPCRDVTGSYGYPDHLHLSRWSAMSATSPWQVASYHIVVVIECWNDTTTRREARTKYVTSP